MKSVIAVLACVLLLSGSATAQATGYTVAVFPTTATNPATAKPIATPITYPVAQVVCNQTRVLETPPIVNPAEGRFADPANTTRDCVVPIEAQFQALPAGSAYKAAYRAVVGTTPGTWSTFTSTFAIVAPQAHPCDGTAATSGAIVEGTRTLSWCWDGKDANGTDTTITAWTVTVDGARQVLTSVTVGATANAAGRRLYSASLPLTRGTRAVRIAGTNAVGEAPFSATFTVTVTAAPAVPSVAEIRSIQ